MEVIKLCKDCESYNKERFTCSKVAGFHNPNDFCGRHDHIIDIPQCKDCKYGFNAYCKRFYTYCTLYDIEMYDDNFCSRGEYYVKW